MARWWKKMSRTDAQQPTKGYPVKYLRLTQNGMAPDPDTWFRGTMFGSLTWSPGWFGEHPVSKAFATFRVVDAGKLVDVYELMLTHDPDRPLNHQHPATWIHWGPDLESYLEANSKEDWFVVVEQTAANQWSITWQQARPAWTPAT